MMSSVLPSLLAVTLFCAAHVHGYKPPIQQPNKSSSRYIAGGLVNAPARRAPVSYPIDCLKLKNGDHPDPTKKCSIKYYTCSNGGTIERECGEHLYYDKDLKVCDLYMHVFDCSGQRRPTTTTSTRAPPITPHPEFNCEKRANAQYPDPKSKCSTKYFVCANGYTTESFCPDTLYYDAEFKQCDAYAHIPNCSGGPRPPKTTQAPVLREPAQKVNFDCESRENGNYKDPKTPCSRFYYTCAHGFASKTQCPGLLYYDPVQKVCGAYAEIFVCSGKRPLPRNPTSSTPGPKPPVYPFDCSSKEDGFFKAGECQKFYWACSGGITTKNPCPQYLYYDAPIKHCSSKKEVPGCGGVRPALTPAPVTTPRPKIPLDCSRKANGFYSAGKCRDIYYSCSGGYGFKMTCAAPLKYDSEWGECNHKSLITECGGKPNPEGPTPTRPSPNANLHPLQTRPTSQQSSRPVSYSQRPSAPVSRNVPSSRPLPLGHQDPKLTVRQQYEQWKARTQGRTSDGPIGV